MMINNSSARLARVLLAFLLGLHVGQVLATRIRPKPSEFEVEQPFCCPLRCDEWCICGAPNEDDEPNLMRIRSAPDLATYTRSCGTDINGSNTCPLLARQANGEEILGNQVTTPDTWEGGASDWWRHMKDRVRLYGVRLDPLEHSTAVVSYLDADGSGNPLPHPAAQAGGAPEVRGCPVFIGASNLGIVVMHIWEVPSFAKIHRDASGRPTGWDVEGQQAAYAEHVVKFLERGFQYYNAHENINAASYIPDSPPVADLTKPGMILDEHSTLWRSFRLFQARAPNRGPGVQVLKNERVATDFRGDLASALGMGISDIARHDPLYIPMDEWDPRPAEFTNILTWQFGPSHPDPSDGGRRKHALRVTWDGVEIAEMSRAWDPAHGTESNDLCRLWVKTQAWPTQEDEDDDVANIGLMVSVHRPGDGDEGKFQRVYNNPDGEWERDNEPPDRMILSTDDTGLDQEIWIWLSDDDDDNWEARDGRRPAYDTWHINAKFVSDDGGSQVYAYKGDATVRSPSTFPRCRGGSWKMSMRDGGVWEREANCQFKCSW